MLGVLVRAFVVGFAIAWAFPAHADDAAQVFKRQFYCIGKPSFTDWTGKPCIARTVYEGWTPEERRKWIDEQLLVPRPRSAIFEGPKCPDCPKIDSLVLSLLNAERRLRDLEWRIDYLETRLLNTHK